MSEPVWTVTVTVPVGLAVRIAGAYVAVGAIVVIPADRVLWALYRRRSFKVGTYREWMASKTSRWYRSGITRWPALVVSATRASYRVRGLEAHR